MRVAQGVHYAEEAIIRDLFVWAIVHRASDVHINLTGDSTEPTVKLHVRHPGGMLNAAYAGTNGRHFETRLLQLCNVPQGASTPPLLSTRFSVELPPDFAAKHGLPPPRVPGGWYLVDLRVEFARTFDGVKFVCRLLDQQRTPSLRGFGMTRALSSVLDRAIQEPMGLVLVSGPTGSGKSTLLNAMLQALNDGQRHILTIERPVEFRLRGDGPITQLQVGGDITFNSALTSTLRQDPDIILVGEINDPETMRTAIAAAQTGHLVLATLHANTAVETVARAVGLLAERDVARLAEVLKFVLATRLVDRYDGELAPQAVHYEDAVWLRDNGMPAWSQVQQSTGAQRVGKVAIMEAFSVDHRVRDAMRALPLDSDAIFGAAAQQLQYETLAMAGVRAVESRGARLSECRTALGRELAARAHPPLRVQLAQLLNTGLSDVSQRIDALLEAQAADGDAEVAQLADLDVATLAQRLAQLMPPTTALAQ
jgi:energy-coupling factor transporter ATP-binding protein EcfA2